MTGMRALLRAMLVNIVCSSTLPPENSNPPILPFFTSSRICFFAALSEVAGRVATTSCPTFSCVFNPAKTESTHCLHRSPSTGTTA